MKKEQWKLFLIIVLTVVSLWAIVKKPTVLGLDLKGGIRVVLEAQTSEEVPEITSDILASFHTAMENRVNALGVSEAVVQPIGTKRLMIELPGFSDPEKAKEYIGKTAKLEFKKLQTNAEGIAEWVPTGVTGKDLEKSMPSSTQSGNWQIAFRMTGEGGKKFGKVTTELVGKPLGIFFNGELISAPNVNEPITQGEGVITGGFTVEEARDMVSLLNAGALPVAAKIIEENTVGPTLGADSIKKSLYAGYVGLGLVAMFMVAYYRLPGLISVAALVLYALFTFAAFKLIPVTLTLAGIAGFILSIGMAVDANILIFERTKEELRLGRTLYTAIETGFDRAFTSIFDSNMTTLISCAILFGLGTGMVRGFALTLAIGVLISMFTAITVTKTFMQLMKSNNIWLYGVKASEISQAKTVRETDPSRAKMGLLNKKNN